MKDFLFLGNGKSNQAMIKYLGSNFEYDLVTKYSELVVLRDNYTFLVVSPSLRISDKMYIFGKSLCKYVTSEFSYAYNLIPKRVKRIMVTGSNGKTTTAMMIATVLRKAGYKVMIGGNIGNPLIATIPHLFDIDFIVIEASSYQLEHFETEFLLDHLIYTTISPNHLDKYIDYNHYRMVKKRASLYARNVISTLKVKRELGLKGCECVEEGLDADKTAFEIVTKLAENYGISRAQVEEYLVHFKKLPHRQEVIYKSEKLIVINDSKSTSIEATNCCQRKYKGQRNIVILGGHPQSLVDDLEIYPNNIYLSYGREWQDNELGIPHINTLEEVIKRAFELVKSEIDLKGILFSPGGSSLYFANYEERGKMFKAEVSKYVP